MALATPDWRLRRTVIFTLAKAREAKKARKAQMEALLEKLAQSGKTIDDLMAELEK